MNESDFDESDFDDWDDEIEAEWADETSED